MKKLSEINSMPQMRSAFSGWFTTLEFSKICQTIVDFEPVEFEEIIKFKGVIQPLSPQSIQLKPEGQRSWSWWQIHCFPSTVFNTNDIYIYKNEKYKIMSKIDHSLSNFVEYHAIKDYE